MTSAGPYRSHAPNADLPGPGDMRGPDDFDDPYEPGPWTCHLCGDVSPYPYCYCPESRRRKGLSW